MSRNCFDFSKSNLVKARIFFLRLYEVCAKALKKKNASALPAIHAMYVSFVSVLRHCPSLCPCFPFFFFLSIYSGVPRGSNIYVELNVAI